MGTLATRTLFGPNSTTVDHVLGAGVIVVSVLVFLGIGWLILQLLRLSQRYAAMVPASAVAASAPAADGPQGEGMVEFTFTTYTGFVLWMVQQQCTYRLPVESARITLRRLLRHNLTRGLLGPGLVFIPFLTLIEYWQQIRRIARQVSGAG